MYLQRYRCALLCPFALIILGCGWLACTLTPILKGWDAFNYTLCYQHCHWRLEIFLFLFNLIVTPNKKSSQCYLCNYVDRRYQVIWILDREVSLVALKMWQLHFFSRHYNSDFRVFLQKAITLSIICYNPCIIYLISFGYLRNCTHYQNCACSKCDTPEKRVSVNWCILHAVLTTVLNLTTVMVNMFAKKSICKNTL